MNYNYQQSFVELTVVYFFLTVRNGDKGHVIFSIYFTILATIYQQDPKFNTVVFSIFRLNVDVLHPTCWDEKDHIFILRKT